MARIKEYVKMILNNYECILLIKENSNQLIVNILLRFSQQHFLSLMA